MDQINETPLNDAASGDDAANVVDASRGQDTKKAAGLGSLSKIVAIVASASLILGLMVLLGIGLANRSPATGRSGITRVGKPAPQMTFTTFDGEAMDLRELLGRPVVINFWASWCGPCRQEATILERLWRTYREHGVVFIGVDIQDSDGDARAFISEFGVTYPNGMDSDGRISIDYGVIGIPVTFLVDREGVVARRWVGGVRQSQMNAWLDELVAGVAPSGPVEGQNLEDYRPLN
ncbi:MAG: TlpA family protein disulfide reductase [Chloroflexi bacterium]|nr:TlpA family protein disulfide reductase [Chloroflexota bacterium]MCH8869011.1 TlpA family protein disulfide reductase [Chloroflexota bacterium]MCI0770587.1 TlpA family protein disulfide reductase [Chloroflexota bacterium]MCI0790394.1 TlpA family protein disulfide reductase [Chloroflexota bacterium]MCI0795363.1 TlpA family protein disulfide reductase [Chloroflexota bacterium]